MKQKTLKYFLKPSKAIIFCEFFGFGVILLFLWLDEILDLPHYLFETIETPVNTAESIFESIMIIIIAIFCIGMTFRLLSKIKVLEGFLPICASCKKIRDSNDHWHPVESYIANHSNVSFSHGICQECMEKLYGDQEWYKKKVGDK
ncbi:MAG: hypothetical protein KAH62_00540 [Desulfobacula sp.]|nr:hypothetical protein [Desulfobacterales bacterium]MCK5695094.1 hypothetical protein [Desulfobacula sp.]